MTASASSAAAPASPTVTPPVAPPASAAVAAALPQCSFTITDAARASVLELRANETDAELLGLRVEVTGTHGVDYTYDLAFELLSEGDEFDIPVPVGDGLTVLISDRDSSKLDGATLDVPSNQHQSGLVLRNPNRPDLGPNAVLELSGTIAENVQEVLDKRINPSIAAHGGFAELVAVEGDTAVIRLGGGCQGCGMANATITAGIEKTLRELISDISHVVDVTDHASGENPYFSA